MCEGELHIPDIAPSPMLDTPVKVWSSFCASGKSIRENNSMRVPTANGPMDEIEGESDPELWVGAAMDDVAEDSPGYVKPFNYLKWYVEQLTLLCKRMFDGTELGRTQARRFAAMAYVFYTFVPGRSCLFCASGCLEGQNFKRKWNDLGRFARHLMEMHVEEQWFFSCKPCRISGDCNCIHNGYPMRKPFTTSRLGLFLRHKCQSQGHRYKLWTFRALMAKAWRGEKDLPRVVSNRQWTMTLVKVKASVYLHPDHFGVALRYFYRGPVRENSSKVSAPMGDRLVAARKRPKKTFIPAPLPDTEAWQTVKARKSRDHCEQEYPSLPVNLPAECSYSPF